MRADQREDREDQREAYVEAVLSLVEQIPEGRVTTYGVIADVVGTGGPRQVGRVMALYGSPVPWWRVVRADGSLPESHQREAVARYRQEGTPLRGRITDAAHLKVDLAVALWAPDESAERP
jgi:alkylated DNA nucleotide flippase Atl1